MKNKNSLVLLALVIITSIIVVLTDGAATSCPKRTEPNHRCRKSCSSDEDCKSKSKKRKKQCICDGPCGLSCIKTSQKCRVDRSLVTSLKQGSVFLNSGPYKNSVFKVGDVVSYKCKNGFTLTGPSQVTCSGIGKWKPWDKGRTECVRRCKDPGNPKDGRIFSRSFDIGQTVRFRCNPGYILKGSASAKCKRDLTWSEPLPKCEVKTCDQPKLPENSRIYRGKEVAYQYGDRIFLRCIDGYYRLGSSILYCHSTGWRPYGITTMKCAPKSCGRPDGARNGRIAGTIFTYKNTVEYKCDHGYRLRGQSTRSCLANQKWSGSSPICERVDCGDPGPLPNGKYDEYGTKFNDKHYVRCNTGYVISGPTEMTCLGSGKWSKKPRCSRVTCDSGHVTIANGKVTGDDAGTSCTDTYNCKLTYTCDNGYDLYSAGHPICQINGQWSKQKSRCEPKNCGDPRPIVGGRLVSGQFVYPNVVKYECYDNYEMDGPDQLKCQADGTWDRQPRCIANCGDPGLPEKANRTFNGFKSGNSILFQCDSGYRLEGVESLTCLQTSARWSARIPYCLPKSCGRPDSVRNGRIAGTIFTYENTVKYKCDHGYRLRGQSTRSCLANQKWSGSSPICERVDCGDPGPVPNGFYENFEQKFNDKRSVKCTPKFAMQGSGGITCQGSGKWSKKPICKFVKCDAGHLNIENGKVTGDDAGTSCTDTYNCKLTYTCDNGYDLIDARQPICQENGQWSYQKSRCELVTCDAGHLNIENGKVTGDDAGTSCTDTYNCKLTYTCDNGYDLIDARQPICQENGQWSYQKSRCERKKCSKPPELKNGYPVSLQPEYFISDVVVFKCNDGFQTSSQVETSCQANGQWSNFTASCEAITCSEPNIANSQSDRDSAPYTVGTRLKIECKAGFKLHGEPTITCNKNGEWDSYPKCESATQNSCESPLGMENGDIRDNQIEVQHLYGKGYSKTARRNQRIPWCGSYYKKSLAVIIRLDKVVRITAVLFQLEWPEYGGPLASFRYFDANDKDDIFKETKRYSLLKRTNKEITIKLEEQIETSHFEIVLHSQVSHTVCESFELFGCNVDSLCQRPSAPKNGEAMGMVYRKGDKAIFSCKHGYKLSGQDHPVCDANGSWEGFTPSCIADDKQVGCYKEELKSFQKQSSNQFSLDTCRASCQKASFSYAISQFSGQCFCGNVIDAKASAEKNCYVPCKADISRKCGSPFAKSLYLAS